MIEIFGWVCTILIIIGFYLNSNKNHISAGIVWIIGDIGWVIYDFIIVNYSHAFLSFIIIAINLKLIYNSKTNYNKEGIEK